MVYIAKFFMPLGVKNRLFQVITCIMWQNAMSLECVLDKIILWE